VKTGWGVVLAGAGIEGAVLPGNGDPLNNTGHQDPHFYSAVTEGTATGKVSDENRVRKNRRKVRTQGRKRRKPVPLKMIWFCGGRGVCLTAPGREDYVTNRTVAWFDRFLKGRKDVRTGPRFSWVDENGTWRDSGGFPLRRVGTVSATGSETLPLVPGPSGGGGAIFATPAPLALNVAIDGPAKDANVVGVPRLRVTYTDTGAPGHTTVYAQLVDPRRNIVVGNVATPIPIELDGEAHSMRLPLEPIASRAPAGGGYKLQIVPATTVYDIQRSAGAIDFSRVDIHLPISKPR
jgi:ABC-2 type transport system ATP-binding protein